MDEFPLTLKSNKKRRHRIIQLSIIIAGIVITVAELIAKLTGSGSFCRSDGCSIVSSFVGNTELLLIGSGILFFGLLLVASFKDQKNQKNQKNQKDHKNQKNHSGKFTGFLLMGALAGEGYLMAFQVFTLREACLFCFIVGALILIYAFFELWGNWTLVLNSAMAFLAVFALGAVVNNPVSKGISENETVLLFSKDCPHCLKVIDFIKENGLNVRTCDYRCQRGLLATLKIEELPVLVASPKNSKKEIYIGADNIIPVLAQDIHPRSLFNLPLERENKTEEQDTGACRIGRSDCDS